MDVHDVLKSPASPYGGRFTLMASSSSRLPAPQPWSADRQFELYRQDARDALRAFLVTVSDRCVAGWHVVHHLGFLPHTSIKNKFPYHK